MAMQTSVTRKRFFCPALRGGLFLLLWLLTLSGWTAGAQTEIIRADPDVMPTTKIVAGCLLRVTVIDEPNLSGEMLVDAEGNLRFSLADGDNSNKEEWAVSVKDKTTDEAASAINESLKKYLRLPDTRLYIVRMPRLKVEIRGAAGKTGILELKKNACLSDALNACEYAPNADLANVLITRLVKPDAKNPQAPPKKRPFTVDFAAFMRGESDDDPKLEEGDVILLPALTVKPPAPEVVFIQVRGEIKQEANIPLAAGMKVKDALERAGGLMETADREKIQLIRAEGKYLSLIADKVDADDPVHNLTLKPGDMLIIAKRDRSLQYSVAGEVSAPNVFPWSPDKKVTLLEAIEQAGGLTKNADSRKGVLTRGAYLNPLTAQGIPFDYEQIKKGKQPNYALEAGDAIYIMPRQRRPSIFQQILPFFFRFLPFGL